MSAWYTIRHRVFQSAWSLAVVLLLLSFSLHTIQVEHLHYGEAQGVHDTHVHEDGAASNDTESLSSFMHTVEKKSFIFFLAVFLLCALVRLTAAPYLVCAPPVIHRILTRLHFVSMRMCASAYALYRLCDYHHCIPNPKYF